MTLKKLTTQYGSTAFWRTSGISVSGPPPQVYSELPVGTFFQIALGAFRTSPAQSLYIEAHEPSLTTRQLKLSLNYVLKLKSLPENAAYSCVFEPENTKLFEAAESKVPPLGIRIIPHLEKSKLNLNLEDNASPLDIIPWKLSIPVVHLDLTSFKKDTTKPEIYKQPYLQLISEYPLSEKFSPMVLKQRTELLR